MPAKDPKAREQELLAQRALIIAKAIDENPGLRQAIIDGIAEADRGEGVPTKE